MDKLRRIARFRALLAAFGAVLYGASPLDVLPDLIPVIGVLDDAVVVPILLLFAFAQYRRSLAPKTAPATGPVPQRPRAR